LRLASGDLEVTAETIIALMKPDAHQCGVELRFERGQGVAARYDEERIRQVLLNLIRNGVEAAGEGGWVDVQVLRARNRAIIEIRDSGEGPPQGLDLFQPFRTSKESGTGLGLSIVHRIVTDHDGKIEHFRDGHQTCFRVEVPVDGPVSDREPARA
jgi:signal transduction histidine kinase